MRASTYKSYLLSVLLVILAFNYTDRLALGLVLQNVKTDLHLSDTQLGLLTGIAFALFYSLLGIPIARWADRGNRVLIISLTTLVWSAAVAMCSVAGNFAQLLLIRTAVATGEAGCIPTAHSLIADYFDRAERPRAVSIYMLGGSLSVIFGYFAAGWFNEFYGWRTTFVLLGLPGIAVAILARYSLREPRHDALRNALGTISVSASSHSPQTHPSLPPSVKLVCLTLWTSRSFRHLLFCFAVISFFGSGIAQWLPAFFIRSYGVATGELGSWFSIIYGVTGLLGTYGGGAWASRYAARNERLQLRVMAFACSSFGVITACVYLAPNFYLALALLGLATVGSTATSGPLFATIQSLVPERMRAMSIAAIYLCANLIGMGLGPLIAGAMSDALRPPWGNESLRYALLILCPGYLWGAWHLWRASRTVEADLLTLQHAGERSSAATIASASASSETSATTWRAPRARSH